MRQGSMEDFVQVNEDGYLVAPTASDYAFDAITSGAVDSAANVTIDATHSTTTIPGSISAAQVAAGQDYDLIAVNLVAGQTYTFAYRSPDGTLEDPLLGLFGPGFTYIDEDDDGGAGRSALLTYTPTTSGTYYLYAASWVPNDTGNYTIDIWSPSDGPDAPGTTASTTTLVEGTNFAYLDAAGDVDVYRIDMTAGNVYNFNYAGGVYAGDWDFPNTPGESIGYLEIVDSEGNVVVEAVNYETSISFLAESDATYYLRVSGYEADMTGGYTLDFGARPISEYDPLEALDWDSSPNVPFVDTDGDDVVDTAYIYFAVDGENFGMLQGEDDSEEALLSFGFSEFEQNAILEALNNEYGFLLGINYVATTNEEEATFRLILTEDEPYGARFLNFTPSYGDDRGTGIFVRDNAGWSYDEQQSLEVGGYDYSLILHEFGHAHGIAHPHDTGGGSEVMLGVTGSQGSLGLFDLNQGVYTAMSYNDAWQLHPNGPSELYGQTVDNGWNTLGAFDIAILEQRYGLAERNTGNDVYTLTDVVDEAYYRTIWDSAGTDAIAYSGTLDARIDLTAATLDYSPTGGGVVSFLLNDPETVASTHPALLLRGGFTIANGVVIENATGGSGNDVLIGNAVVNTLTGNDGSDVLMGRGGDDFLLGGNGSDTASYATATGSVTVDLGAQTATGADGNDTLTSVENVTGSNFDDMLIGSGGANIIAAGSGNDVVRGGNGLDVVTLGAGDDRFIAEVGATEVALRSGSMSVDIITDFDGAGDDLIDLSGLGTNFTFRETDANKSAGDLTYKSYGNVNAAERALGYDIDGQAGASNVSGPVTVVYGNTDGGAADFAIILLNTSSVEAGDFIFA